MREEIIKLTDLWYSIVSLDHHKDRDCHWYINTVYSYGQPPKFRLEHYGYIGEDLEGEFETYEDAEKGLIDALKEALNNQKEWAEGVLEDVSNWDSDQIENAKKIIDLVPETLNNLKENK